MYRVIYITKPTEEHPLGELRDEIIREHSKDLAEREFWRMNKSVGHIVAVELLN